MSLRFIYGRAGSGKSYRMFCEIKHSIGAEEGCPIIILVPEDFSFQAEKDLLKAAGESGIMKARVLSFKRLAYSVLAEVGGMTRRHMNSAGRCMLIHGILEKYQNDLKAFKKAVKMRGFVNSISDMITELKIYGVTGEELAGAAQKIQSDSMLYDKLSDISLIFSSFQEMLHRNYIDSEDDLDLLAQKIDKSHIFDGAEVWVDGFSVFTPQQYRVLEKIMRKAKRVNITLCSGCNMRGPCSRADVFSSIRDIENRIVKIAGDKNISIEEPIKINDEVCYKFRDNPELSHLEKNLFSYPYKSYEPETSCISVFEAVNKYTEVENAARDIVSLCRDENFRYSDIAVVTRDVQGYENLVGAIFTEYGIPYFLDEKRDIGGNPLIVLVQSCLEIVYRNWTYESVFRYLKTGLSGIDRDDIDLIENYVLSSGIKGKKWTDGKEWWYWPDNGYEGSLPEDVRERLIRINEIRNKICEPLIKFQESITGGKKARDISLALFDFLSSIGVPQKIQERIDKFKGDGELDLASEYGKIWNIFIETMDQIVEVLGDEIMTPDQYGKVLSSGFEEYKIGLIPPALDQVTFGNVERIKSHNVKALFVLGVNDGIFPAAASGEGILSDSERESLKEAGLELAPDSRDRVFDEQYVVYTTFTRTDRYLKISYPIADNEGRSMRPSIIIYRLRKIFKNLKEYSNITGSDSSDEDLNSINTPVPTFNELVHQFRKNADGIKMNPLWRDVYSWYAVQDEWKDRLGKASSGIYYTNQLKPADKKKIRDLYGKQLRFSVSRLEKFAQCPFAYFMQYALKARERKVYELSSPDLGSFIHTVLDNFSTYLDNQNIRWRDLDRDSCSSIVSSIVDETVQNAAGSILSSSPRYSYFKEKLKSIVDRAVWLISLHIKKGGFEPSGHEVTFDENGKYPPISIELPSGERVSLIGRIDRVDTMEGEDGVYVRIVDYKSGNKDFNLSDIYNGLELQLLIYLDAILEYASKNTQKTVIPAGVLYFRIDDPIIKSSGELSDEEIKEKIMKDLKMRGLLLSDVRVVRAMDRDADGWSLIIPAAIRSSGLDAKSSAATLDEFNALRKHIKSVIINLCEDMLRGNIEIKPYKNRNRISCEYCSYKPVCRFDVSVEENSYRLIKNVKKDEIWKALLQGKEGGVNDGAKMD